MIAAVMVGCIAPALDANVLQNPGFESGALSPWYQAVGGGAEAWNVTTSGPHSGVYCATNVGNEQIRQDFSPTPTGSITEVSFWVKQPEVQISAVDFFYQDGTSNEFLVFLSSADWQFFNVTSHLTAGKNLVGMGVWGYAGGPPQEDRTYLDDVTIVPEPAALSVLLLLALGVRRREERGLGGWRTNRSKRPRRGGRGSLRRRQKGVAIAAETLDPP